MPQQYTYDEPVFRRAYEVLSESDGGASLADESFEERHEDDHYSGRRP